MSRSLSVTLVLVVLLLGSSLPGLTAVAARQESAPAKVLRINWGPGVPEIDPQFSHEGQWSISGGLDYEGLTRLDENAQVVPGAAESWDLSPEGKTITFHLRKGLAYSDGVPVIAGDFVYAAERLCSPELNSYSAHLLFDVIGCEEWFHSAADPVAVEAARAMFGVRAVDDRTLEYRFERPAPYFIVQASNWSTIPLRQELVEAGGSRWWANPATRIGNGPFRLMEYNADEAEPRVRYARSEHYWGGRTKLDELEFLFLEVGPATEAYHNGAVDVIWPGETAIPALEADPVLSREVVTIPDAGTDYFNFNLNREPFQDLKVREAFSYAFDRETWCKRLVLAGTCLTALSLIPPGLPGHIDTDAFAFDPNKARQALAESSYGGPENLPEITWYGEKDDPGSAFDAQWYYEQFRQVLGVELNLVFLPGEELDALFEDPATLPQIHESAWFGQPEPRGWFPNWRCDSPMNDHGYCNPALDALLDRADAELDPEERIALYEDAGRLLVADAPVIFAQTITSTWLVKPYVTGYTRATGVNGDWPGWMNLLTVDVERPA